MDFLHRTSFQALEDGLQEFTKVDLSAVEDCLDCQMPVQAEPRMALDASTVPVLTLRQALHKQGWTAEERHVVHSLMVSAIHNDFSIIGLQYRRWYLQCCLKSQWLFDQGVTTWPSKQHQLFFLLHLKGNIPQPGLGSAAYKAFLDGSGNAVEAHQGDDHFQDDADADAAAMPIQDAVGYTDRDEVLVDGIVRDGPILPCALRGGPSFPCA